MAKVRPQFIALICQKCEDSIVVRRGDLPDHCPKCREVSYWRVPVQGELTADDKRFLRSIRVKFEDARK